VAPIFVRFRGAASWSLADTPRLDRFFRERFGRALPVSAYGQTPVHDRLHLDHHQALDVAVHPDSPEGAALLSFLRGAGISFIRVPGRDDWRCDGGSHPRRRSVSADAALTPPAARPTHERASIAHRGVAPYRAGSPEVIEAGRRWRRRPRQRCQLASVIARLGLVRRP